MYVLMCMSYTRPDESKLLKFDTDGTCAPLLSKAIPSPSDIPLCSQFNPSIDAKLLDEILDGLNFPDGKLESLLDLLIGTYFQMEKVSVVTKETCSDVAKIRLKLDQVIMEAVKIVNHKP